MEESPHEPTASFTPTEIFGLSCCLAATQAHHAQEVQSDDPCAELDHYLSNLLKLPGIEMLNFWMVSLLNINFNIARYLLMIHYTG